MTEDKMSEIHKSIHELDTVFTVKSYDELKQFLNEHYYGKTDNDEDNEEASPTPADRDFAEGSAESSPEPEPEKSSDEDVLNDDKVQELLKGLDG